MTRIEVMTPIFLWFISLVIWIFTMYKGITAKDEKEYKRYSDLSLIFLMFMWINYYIYRYGVYVYNLK